ncbi:MAG: methyltransferase domain-containing protein [Candidatus Omnitrophota bacterium]|jgi:SAM-dependent methyltransferase
MFREESLWIKDKLNQLDLPAASDILDVGSSTKKIRETIQPHIDKNVFLPLRKKGYHIAHMDKKSGDGIDIVGNIEDSGIVNEIGRDFKLVICTSLLEHVTDVEKTAENIVHLVSQGGYLLLSVPYNYPKHADPIDTLYRPSDRQLQELLSKFADIKVIYSDILVIRDWAYYLYRGIFPFWGFHICQFWRNFSDKFRWKISILLVQVS